jgi:hypothetical protein
LIAWLLVVHEYENILSFTVFSDIIRRPGGILFISLSHIPSCIGLTVDYIINISNYTEEKKKWTSYFHVYSESDLAPPYG